MYPAVRPRNILSLFAVISAASGLAQIGSNLLRGAPANPLEAFVHAGFIWMLFGILSLVAIETARRFPLERSRLAQSLPRHAAAFVAISMTHTVLYVPFARLVLGRAGAATMADEIVVSLISNLRGDIFIYGGMIGAYYLFALYRQNTAKPVVDAQPVAAPVAQASYVTRIPLKEEGRVAFVETAEVERIEADGDYVRIHTKRGARLHRQSLATLERQLDPSQFARVHRSTIVRLADIGELQPMFPGEFVAIMTSGARVKVSRTYRTGLVEALGMKA